MDDIQLELVALTFLNLWKIFKEIQRKQCAKRLAARPIDRNRSPQGYLIAVFLKMKEEDEEQFFMHTRMTNEVYDLLLNMMRSHLVRQHKQTCPEKRLIITILHLAQGMSFQSIALAHKMGKSTVRKIVLETCELLWTELSQIYMSEPTISRYSDIAKDFKKMWNIPNCVGAIDGKHIAISCPPNSGTTFYNYKKFYSIVLVATCDAKYTFTSVDVSSCGSHNIGGVLQHSLFGQALISNQLALPPNAPLWNGATEHFPHFFVADSVFPLKRNIMRPYPRAQLSREKAIFNYRLTRALRVIENSFGILMTRWRVLRTVLELYPENCDKIVLACLVLHNFTMLSDHKRWYCPESYVDLESADGTVRNGDWRSDVSHYQGPLLSIMSHSRNATKAAFNLRNTLANYFVNEGAIPFQENQIK